MTTADTLKAVNILEHYGYKAQREILVEECAELIKAVSKLKRAENNEDTEKEHEALMNYIGEMVDVNVMLEQMFNALTPALKAEYNKLITKKLDRQLERIKEEKESYEKWREGVQA